MSHRIVLVFLLCLVHPVWSQPSQEDVQLTVHFTEFLAGEPLTPTERDVVVAELYDGFANERSLYDKSLQNAAAAYQALRQIEEPVQLGLARQELLGQYYTLLKSGHQSPTLEVIFRKVQPLAWDGTRNMVLTAADLNGVLEYLSFVQQTQGASSLSERDREAIKEQFIAGFGSLSDEQMGFVCSGNLVWQTVAANWNRAHQEQKALWAQQYAQTAPVETTAADMDARDYQKLSRILMHTHAASMNMIEGAGGSNRYWGVVEDPRY